MIATHKYTTKCLEKLHFARMNLKINKSAPNVNTPYKTDKTRNRTFIVFIVLKIFFFKKLEIELDLIV